MPDDISAVLRSFPLPPPERVEPLRSAGGFSGASLWRVTVGPAQFCLKKWPENTNPPRLAAIHRVLRHVTDHGLSFVPAPLATTEGTTIVSHAQALWELAPWMSGEADLRPAVPSNRVSNALRALAQFHQAVSTYPGDDEFPAASIGLPPGLVSRVEAIERQLKGGLRALQTAEIPPRWHMLQPRRDRVVQLFMDAAPGTLPNLRGSIMPVPLQICLRDIWSAHVLFVGDEVTAFVDFDAMRVDNVAVDLARLLASYTSDIDRWDHGYHAYLQVQPSTRVELRLIIAYEHAAALLTGIQWLEWILLEGKDFDPLRIIPRLDASIQRLEHLNSRLRSRRGDSGQIAVDP